MTDTFPLSSRHLMRVLVSALCLFIPYFTLATDCYAENAVSVGYGYGMWNGPDVGRIENEQSYDYVAISYLYEMPLTSQVAFVLEPFLNIVNRPDDGVDVGFKACFKGYLLKIARHGWLYLTAGTGATYTSIKFPGQGTHGLFVLLGGIGYHYGMVFTEVRFQHYSNGGLARPNHSINSNMLKVGYYF